MHSVKYGFASYLGKSICELSKEYSHIHPNYLKRDLIGLEFPVFYMPLSEIDFPPNHRRRHMPTVSQYSKQQNYTEAPPILVSGDKFIDGGHRFLAYELAGRRTIPVVDIEFTHCNRFA